MSSTPPSPPEVSKPARPGLVTAAGILLVVGGALNLLGATRLFALDVGTIGTAFGTLFLIIGAAALFAGVKVLALSETGRRVGIGVIGVSAILNVWAITEGVTTSYINLAVNIFVIYVLISTKEAFTKD